MKYILTVGSGRSGSTVVENYMFVKTESVTIGELMYIWDRGMQQNWKCSCGSQFRDCRFWQSVLREAGIDGQDIKYAQRMVRYRKKYASIRGIIFYSIIAKISQRHFREKHELVNAYRKIIQGVKKVTGNKHIIDSSKEPGHAFVNRHMKEILFVHLVREPSAVAYSWSQKKKNPVNTSSVKYLPTQGTTSVLLEWTIINLITLMSKLKIIQPTIK